jgi:hypothetical protein
VTSLRIDVQGDVVSSRTRIRADCSNAPAVIGRPNRRRFGVAARETGSWRLSSAVRGAIPSAR